MSKDIKDVKPGWYEIRVSTSSWMLRDKGKKLPGSKTSVLALVYSVKDVFVNYSSVGSSKEIKIYYYSYKDKTWGRLLIDGNSYSDNNPLFYPVTNEQRHYIINTFFECKNIAKTMKNILGKI